MTNKFKFTKKAVELLPFSEKQTIYWDTELKGFGLVIGKNTKTYIVQRNVNRTDKRVKIDRTNIISTEEARKKAMKLLSEMQSGIDPILRSRNLKIKGVTLEQIFKKYMSDKSARLRPKTIRHYNDTIKNHLSCWKSKALSSITPDMIINKHSEIFKTSPYAALHTFKLLSALYTYAEVDNNDLKNPVKVLKTKNLLVKKTRRDSLIKDHELPIWYDAVNSLENISIRDALIFLLFTGMRKNEVFKMKWEYIDFHEKTIKIPTTKNGKPLKLPLSDFLITLLQKRHKDKSLWVFEGKSKDGHLSETRTAISQIEEMTSIKFMIHDLRRTYTTIAEKTNISAYTLKRLLNHSNSNDVTAGYIHSDMNRLREAVENITKSITDLITSKKDNLNA